MEDFKFDYDEENDDLFVYLPNSKSEGAVEIGNFVFDFDKDKNLMAIEILDASKVLSKLISKIIELNNIKDIKVNVINFRNMNAIKVDITTDIDKASAVITIPSIKEESPALSY
jgi:uncharacterized protein YuzE